MSSVSEVEHRVDRVGRWLLGILLLAVLLRFWNIDYPAWANVDEGHIVDSALLLGKQGLNPGWFANPSLFLYTLFAVDGVFYLGGRLMGVFASPTDFADFYFAHPVVLHIVGRGLSAVFGLAWLLMIFRIGRRWWGSGVGLAATGLMAISPIAVAMARVAKVDMLMNLLLLIAAWLVLRYLDERRTAWIWTAGVAVGLAASAKYTAAVAGLWLAVAPFVVRRGRAALAEAGGAVALAGIAFVVGTPFAVLDWPTFAGYFVDLASLMRRPWYGGEDMLGYTYYLFQSFPRTLGWPATVLGLLGLGRWVARGGRRERLLAGFVVTFYAVMGYGKVAGDSYIFPVLPFLALAGADLVVATGAALAPSRSSWHRWALTACAVTCTLPPLASTLRQGVLLAARDSRQLAGAWITEHLPPGTRIVSEAYGPFLPIVAGRLREILAEVERSRPGHGMRTRFEMGRLKPRAGFWYYEMSLFRNDRFMMTPAAEEYDLDRFLGHGYSVVVLSSGVYDRYRRLPGRYPIQNAFFDRVTARGVLLARFGPPTPWCCPTTLNERLAERAARVWGRPGPTLLVYRVGNG